MKSSRAKILCFLVLFVFATRTCECNNETETKDAIKIEDKGKVEEKAHEDEDLSLDFIYDGDSSKESEDGAHIESISGKALEDRIVDGLYHYHKTGEMTKQLNHDLEKVQQIKGLPNEPFKHKDSEQKQGIELKEFTFCTLCSIAAKILVTYRQLGGSKDFASTALKMLCYQIESKNVCNGAIDLNIDIFIYILDKKPDITTSKICSIIGQSYKCKDPKGDHTWNVYLPPKISNKANITAVKNTTSSNKPLRILHITDMHYDYKYKAGGNTNCGEPLCCGVDQGKPKSPDLAAGVWGDYRSCDMPLYAVENLMEAASKQDADIVYHTGDIINHRIWETSKKTNSKSILDVNELFRKKFPNTTIYHIAGNHEPNPLNEFAPEHIIKNDLSTHWLYDLLAEEWSTWLPKETQQSIRKGGYYTVLVRPGFRIIALNSNVCYVYNWWLLYNDEDPYGQLQWLSDTLYQAELDGEVVHILSHVPSGDKECYKKWSHEYNRIIRRYANIIKAQFVGHTHFNELHFFYEDDYNKEHPINVAFNGGSFTTFIDVNPNFRIYEVNPETYQVEDYEDWIYNITEANKHDRSVPPKWYKLYSFKEAYGLPSMNLPELGKFVRSLATNSSHLDTYFRLKVRDGDVSLKKGCNQKCNEEQLCNLVTSEFGVVSRCEKLVGEYRQANSLV